MEILVMKILLALSLALIVFLLSFRKLEDGRIYVVRRAGADYRYILVYKDHALRYDNDQRGPKVAYSKGSSGTGFNILNYYLIGIPFIFSIKEIPYKKVNVTGAGPEATFEAAPGSSTTYAKAQQDTYGVVLQNRYDKNGVVVELFQYAIKGMVVYPQQWMTNNDDPHEALQLMLEGLANNYLGAHSIKALRTDTDGNEKEFREYILSNNEKFEKELGFRVVNLFIGQQKASYEEEQLMQEQENQRLRNEVLETKVLKENELMVQTAEARKKVAVLEGEGEAARIKATYGALSSPEDHRSYQSEQFRRAMADTRANVVSLGGDRVPIAFMANGKGEAA